MIVWRFYGEPQASENSDLSCWALQPKDHALGPIEAKAVAQQNAGPVLIEGAMDLDHLVPDKGALLARHEFFRGVSDEVLRKLAVHARLIGYPIGTTIFAKGDPGLGLLAVVSGVVRISVPREGRKGSRAEARRCK